MADKSPKACAGKACQLKQAEASTTDPSLFDEDGEYAGPDRRQSVIDRRTEYTGLERRRGPGKRRSEFMKSAEEGEMSPEQFLFIKAIDAYKRANNRPYPTWTEVLEVIRKLGYRKTVKMSVRLDGADDWTEAPDAPAFTQAPKEHNEAA